MPTAQEVFESTTATIVRAIEEGAGSWSMPWSRDGLAFPMNPTHREALPGRERARPHGLDAHRRVGVRGVGDLQAVGEHRRPGPQG